MADSPQVVEPRSGVSPERVSALWAEQVDVTPVSVRRVSRPNTALLALVVALVRFVYVADRTTVSLTPDEFASLGVARFLTGGEFNMLVAGTYRFAPALLLTPWTWLSDDPAVIVRLGLLTNALVAGSTVFVLVPLVERLTSFGRSGVVFASGLVAVLPQSLEASAHLWAEPLVTLSFLGVLLSALRFADAPGPRPAFVVIGWSSLAIASHGRLLPLAVLSSVFLVVWSIWSRRWVLAGIAASVAGIGLIGVTRLQRWIVAEVWEFPSSGNSAATVFRRLGRPLEVLDAAAGQTWYQLAASGLLVGLGAVELLRRTLGRAGPGPRRDAWITIGATLPLIGVSFAFMSDVGRADHVLYGRYIDAVIWPVIILGGHWLVLVRPRMSTRRRRFVLGAGVAVFVELGLLVHQLHRHQVRVPGVNAMIGGIVPLSDNGSINAMVVTAGALALAGVLLLAARAQIADRRVWSFVLVAIVATAGVRLWAIQRPDANRSAPGQEARAILDLPGAPRPGTSIGVALMPNDFGPIIPRISQLFAAYSYQLYLPEYRFVFDNGPFDDVGPYVFAVDNDALLLRNGGTIVWEHPSVAMALWREADLEVAEAGEGVGD